MELYEALKVVIAEVQWVFFLLIAVGCVIGLGGTLLYSRGYDRLGKTGIVVGIFVYGMWAGTMLCRLLILVRL